jgi:hypothetical protein
MAMPVRAIGETKYVALARSTSCVPGRSLQAICTINIDPDGGHPWV